MELQHHSEHERINEPRWTTVQNCTKGGGQQGPAGVPAGTERREE